MASTLTVKPAEGRRVRMPDRDFSVMPADGMTVQDAPYYRQRLADGDLVLADDPASAPKATPKATKL